MEISREFFGRLQAATRSTTDPILRAEREMLLDKLRKYIVPDEMADARERFRARMDSANRHFDRAQSIKKSFAVSQLAGESSDRRHALRATPAGVDSLPAADTRPSRFMPQVEVRPGESLQAALLRAHAENDTSELDTSPARPWPGVRSRDAGAISKAVPAAELAKAAKATPQRVEDEISRLGFERIGNGQSLRCASCPDTVFWTGTGSSPLKRARVHFSTIHGPMAVRVVDTRENFGGSNRNF